MGRKSEGPRKPRLALTLEKDSFEEPKHSAAVPQAKEDQLKAIAHAAALAVGSEARTLITPKPTLGSVPGSEEFKAPPPKYPASQILRPSFAQGTEGGADSSAAASVAEPQPVVATAESPTAGSNPLAVLLGYGSMDEGEDEQSASPCTHIMKVGKLDSQQLAEQQIQPLGEDGVTTSSSQEGTDGQAGSKDLDAELASFLSELETSGLLKEDISTPGAAGDQADEGPAVPAGTEQQQRAEHVPLQGSAVEAPPGAQHGQQAADHQQQEQQQEVAGGVVEEGVEGQVEEGASAEQRVLGDVPGAEEWCRVMDMGSRQIYFWNQKTDEVAWKPPEGATRAVVAAGEDDGKGCADADMAEAPLAVEQEQPEFPGGMDRQEPQQQHLVLAGTEDGLDHAAQMRPGSRMPCDNGRLSTQSNISSGEEGALPQEGPQQQGAAAHVDLLVAPSKDIIVATASVAQRCTEAAGSWLDTVPQVVRLAIEAQSLSTLLALFSQQQAAAVEAQAPEAAFNWSSFESVLSNALAALDSQLPAAIQAAHQLHTSMAAAHQQGHGNEGAVAEQLAAGGRELGADEESAPPLPPEPERGEQAAAQLPQPQALGQHQQQQAVTSQEEATGLSDGTAGKGEEEPPPLPPEDVPMDLDDDISAPVLRKSAAAAVGAGIGVEGYGDGNTSEEEGEITDAPGNQQQPLMPSQSPLAAAASGVTAPVDGATSVPHLPSSSYPFPPWLGSYPLPLPMPMVPGHPLPFHPLFLPPVGAYPPPYPYGHYTGTYVAAADTAKPAPAEPPLPSEPQAAQPSQVKKREYSAQAQPTAAAADAMFQPPLPSDNGTESLVSSAVQLPPEQRAQQGGEEALLAKKRKQEKATAAIGKKAKASKLDKGTVSLINKWQAVQKQVQKLEDAEEAAAALEADPEAKLRADEERRARDSEEWRMQQLRTGAVGDNANFAPLVGDWRDKLRKVKKKKSKAAADLSTSTAAGVPNLDAVSEGLPDGWRAMFDKTSSKVYYGNLRTKETQWDRPT